MRRPPRPPSSYRGRSVREHRVLQRRLGHAARDRPAGVEARGVRHAAVERHRAVGRLEADDAAGRGRVAHAAAGVGARRVVDDLGGDRDGRARGGAARNPRADRAGCGRSAGPGVWPIIPQASCVIASLPSETAPAASMRCTTPALEVAGPAAARQGAPPVVCRPATSKQSFHPHTVPARGPTSSPRVARAASERARSRAPSASSSQTAPRCSELAGQLERALDALDDSAGGHHGVE